MRQGDAGDGNELYNGWQTQLIKGETQLRINTCGVKRRNTPVDTVNEAGGGHKVQRILKNAQPRSKRRQALVDGE